MTPQAPAKLRLEQNALVAGVVLFFACAIISYFGWLPLSLPSRMIGAFIPEGNCVAYKPKTLPMYFCSIKVALLVLIPAVIVMVIAFLARNEIAQAVQGITSKVPPGFRFLVAPLTATILFTLSWAPVHYRTAESIGLLPQRAFPAVIGLFTWGIARFGPNIQASLRSFFEARDQVPKLLRIAGVVLIPLTLALVITFEERVSAAALKEQIIVLASMASGYLMLAPRAGSVTAAFQRWSDQRAPGSGR